MRILWGRANSSNVMKVIWLLEELAQPYERRDVGGPFGQTDTPEYRRMNPMGLVPTLDEDGFTLFESNAILRYLCATHAPTSTLWPADTRARARVDQWMDWQQTAMSRPATTVFIGLVRTPPEKRDMAAIGAAKDELVRYWEMLDAQLGGHAFAAGDAFTLADIALGVHVHRWFSFDFARPEMPNLAKWYERLKSRPAYAAHVALPMT
jgi:glutathione S-transferase